MAHAWWSGSPHSFHHQESLFMTRTLASSAPSAPHPARRRLLALGSAALATALLMFDPAFGDD